MELAAATFFIFLCAIAIGVVVLPLLFISRALRLLKNSYAKLFHKTPRKA